MPPDKAKHIKIDEKVKIAIPASELKIGMYVSELDCPWEETPFLFQGFTIEAPEDIEAVKSHCHSVVIDKSLSRDLTLPRRAGSGLTQAVITEYKTSSQGRKRFRLFGKRSLKPHDLIDLHKELQPAFTTFTSSQNLIGSIWEDVRLGKGIDTLAAKEAVAKCVDSIARNASALMLLGQIKNKDAYTSQHSMNVAIFSIAFGKQLGLSHRQLNEVGLAGLLHDAGKMLTPDDILKKPGRLNREEFEIMKRHPTDGRDILSNSPEMTENTIEVAYSHHERLHGGGYPQGLVGSGISLYTRIVSIVDFFDAITSERTYKYGSSAFQALRMLHAGSIETAFDQELVAQFVECVGVFPAGSVVELHNGEIGIVVQTHRKHRLKPKVLVILDAEKQQCPVFYLNLAESPVDHTGVPYHIKTVHHPREFNIDIGGFIQKYLLQGELGLL